MATTALFPVMLSAPNVTADAPGQVDANEQPTTGGAIHIEFTSGRESEIRTPGQTSEVQTITIAETVHKFSDYHLWFRVLRANRSHISRTLSTNNVVGHIASHL
jgi:hypothetical protein